MQSTRSPAELKLLLPPKGLPLQEGWQEKGSDVENGQEWLRGGQICRPGWVRVLRGEASQEAQARPPLDS